MINLAVIFSFFLQIMNPGVQTIGNSGGIYNPGTAPPTCGTEPTWDYEFLATSIAPGTLGPGSTITDSSGNGHTATIAAGAPVAGTAITTPNGTQTLQMLADTYANLAGTAIANGTSVSIYATYSIDSTRDEKKTLTSTSTASGAYGYFTNSNSYGAQGMDVTSEFNVGMGTIAPPPLAPNWQTSGVVFSAGSPPVFYRSNGSGGMVVDTTVNGTNSASNAGIDIVFSNFNGGISEGFSGAIVKLTIKAATTTLAQANTVACLAKQNYGVN